MPHPEIPDYVGGRTFVLIPVKTHLPAPQDPDFAPDLLLQMQKEHARQYCP